MSEDNITIEISENAEGHKSLFILNKNGGYRVAGPKSCGGLKSVSSIQADPAEVLRGLMDVSDVVTTLIEQARKEERERVKKELIEYKNSINEAYIEGAFAIIENKVSASAGTEQGGGTDE